MGPAGEPSLLSRLDALRDRYALRALIAVAVQLVLLLGVILYGLWAPSLGARVLLPTLAMLPVWAAMIWVTLNRPWEWGGIQPRAPATRFWGHYWIYWEGALIYGGTLGITQQHASLFSGAKEHVAKLAAPHLDPLKRIPPEEIQAWASDALGALILNGPGLGWLAVGGAAALVGLIAFLLPR